MWLNAFVGLYYQFDTMVYPEFKSRTLIGRVTDFLTGGNSDLPDSESMRKKCLFTYLDVVRRDLTEFTANTTVDKIVNYAVQAVTCLTVQRIANGDKPNVWTDGKLVSVSAHSRVGQGNQQLDSSCGCRCKVNYITSSCIHSLQCNSITWC